MLETELKCMISKEVFETIKKMYPWDSSKLQENHYYRDPSGQLGAARTVFRIRVKDGVYKIQVKAHKNEGSPLQVCEETEFPSEDAPDVIPAADALKYTGIATGDLEKLGYNTTLRYSFMWNPHTEICLDKTDCFDETDYEIEIEYCGECPEALLSELKAIGVEFKEKSVGKYTRFIRKFQSMLQSQ